MVGQRPIELQELSKYFNMPEKAVAKELGICLTSLKKMARQCGVTRWPYRKIKSLDKKLRKLEVAMSTAKDDPSMVYAKWGDNETASSCSSTSPTPLSDDASVATTPRQAHDCSPSPNSRLSPVSRPQPADIQISPNAAQAAIDCSPIPVRLQQSGTSGAAGEPMKLELSLSPSMLQSVASGASNFTFVVHGVDAQVSYPSNQGGKKDTSGFGSTTFASSLLSAPSHSSLPAIKIEPQSPEPESLSDEDIIAMLAQCAGSQPSQGPMDIDSSRNSSKCGNQTLSDAEIMRALAGCCEIPSSFGFENDHDEGQIPSLSSMGAAPASQDGQAFMGLGDDEVFHSFHVFPCDGNSDQFGDITA